MIAAALLLSAMMGATPTCAKPAATQQSDAPMPGVRHVFQNGERYPLRLLWIGPQGRKVDQGSIAPGAYLSVQTFVGHAFELIDPAGRCRLLVRIGDAFTGTYIGTSRYRSVAARTGWLVFIDQALHPDTEPARTALDTITRMLKQVDAVLPAASLRQLRSTPIFLLDHSGSSQMFHRDPDWLTAHGRTVEMLDGIEVSDAGLFVESAKVQPGSLLHELAHAYYSRLENKDRTEIERTYRTAMESGRYRSVKRHDGTVGEAYARSNAAEYFAELSEAYFSRNDFFPFTQAELVAYDPAGERLIAALWR